MTAAPLTAWLPGAGWALQAGSHLRWRLRQARADAADRSGRSFRYVHPIVGPFVYHPGDYLSRRVFLYDDFEHHEIEFAIESSRAGGTILDVGANIGLFTAACARAAGGQGDVIALEPGPRTFGKLTHTCARLGLANVTALEIAAGPTNGFADFISYRSGPDVQQHLADERPHAPGEALSVEIRRLDDVCGRKADAVTLVKVDIQGHELGALHGAERILQNRRANLIVEFYPAGLAAAGGSCVTLWALLHGTHQCIGIYGADGSPLPTLESSLNASSAEDFFNTLWIPRC